MRIAKIILVLLVSLSVALLPAVGGAAALTLHAPDAASQAMGVDVADGASDPMAMVEPIDDCCDHGKTPCDQDKNCACALMCAMHCFNFPTVEGSEIVFPLTVAAKILPSADLAVALATGAPPFRPPRV
jgi:hypothetical protein